MEVVNLALCASKYYNKYMKLIAFTIFLITGHLFAAQWATVSSEKAVIYSDQQMTSAIGFVKRGKKIRVGEVARNRGTLLPVVVNEKVAYIKITDLKTAAEEKLVISATARRREVNKKSKKESRLGLSYTRFLTNIEAIDSTDSTDFAFNGFALKGYMKNNYTRLSYAAEIGYMSSSDEDKLNEFELYYLNFDGMFRLLDFDNLQLSLYAGLSLIPLSQYSFNDLFTANSAGYGGYGGAELFIGLNNSFGLHARMQYTYIQMVGYSIPKSEVVGVDSTYDPGLGGLSFGGAITYVF